MWNQKTKLIDTEELGGGGGQKWVKVIKGTDFQLKNKHHGDVTWCMATVVNNTILHVWKLVKEQTLKFLSHTQKRQQTYSTYHN